MSHKIKFKGKIYTVIEEQDVKDSTIIKFRARVKNSKGEEFTFIYSAIGYYLYDSKGNRIAETISVQEWNI